ncbi:MAG: alkylphosphonate utilization protein [Rhodobacterales bacterium]|nr:MAG: alkylphosphonate utilization protein [Rhodobacterales bacterium]
MTTPPQALRLRGALTLRDGALTQRTVAIEGSRISAGPFPAVDLSGYMIMPGMVDLGHDPRDTRSIAELRADAAKAGVTTGWITLAQDLAADQSLTELAARKGPDLRGRLLSDRMDHTAPERLIERVRRFDLDMVLFHDTRPGQNARSDKATTDWRNGSAAPRRLCQLAEAFDALGVVYGSLADPDGETRETSSMLGARLCDSPDSYAAASVAHAVGDPVVMEAASALPGWSGPVSAQPLLRAGRCQALRSGTRLGSLLDAVLTLAGDDLDRLAATWRIVAELPAQIMRLPDRGIIARGLRADLVIIDTATRQLAGTIVAGRPVWLSGPLRQRFAQVIPAPTLIAAAE